MGSQQSRIQQLNNNNNKLHSCRHLVIHLTQVGRASPMWKLKKDTFWEVWRSRLSWGSFCCEHHREYLQGKYCDWRLRGLGTRSRSWGFPKFIVFGWLWGSDDLQCIQAFISAFVHKYAELLHCNRHRVKYGRLRNKHIRGGPCLEPTERCVGLWCPQSWWVPWSGSPLPKKELSSAWEAALRRAKSQRAISKWPSKQQGRVIEALGKEWARAEARKGKVHGETGKCSKKWFIWIYFYICDSISIL